MDELKPEDDMKADRSDRRTGRSRQSSERDADPQINFDDVDLDDADDGRPTRGSKARRERDEEQYEEYEEEVESDEGDDEERQVERRPRKRKKACETRLSSVHHDGGGDPRSAAADCWRGFRAEITILIQRANGFR